MTLLYPHKQEVYSLAKKYKIKRRKRNAFYKAGPRTLTVVLTTVAVVALIFVGISIYNPVYDFIMNIGRPSDPQVTIPDPVPTTTAPATTEPTQPPEPPPPEMRTGLKAVYLPIAQAADPALLAQFLDNMPQDTNAVMLDCKDAQGKLYYQSSNAQAIAWEAMTENAIALAPVVEALNAKNIALIARMQTFSDPVAARGDRDANAITYSGSAMLWLDNTAAQGGKPWANPYAPDMHHYLTALAVELAENGAAMVVLDGVSFPVDMTGTASYGPLATTMSRQETLKTFVAGVTAVLEPLGVRTSVLLPATAVSHVNRDSRFGGNPLDMAGNHVMLSILPESLATGYLAEGVFVTRPLLDIAATVRDVLGHTAANAPEGQEIMPLLRDTSGLSPQQVAAQLESAADTGCTEYILYP